jgi:methyl-accepting chemotaxis protein
MSEQIKKIDTENQVVDNESIVAVQDSSVDNFNFQNFINELIDNEKQLSNLKDQGFLKQNWNSLTGKNTSILIDSLDLNNQFMKFSIFLHNELYKNAKLIAENQNKISDSSKNIIENQEKVTRTDENLKIATERFNDTTDKLKKISQKLDSTLEDVSKQSTEIENIIINMKKLVSEFFEESQKVNKKLKWLSLALLVSLLLIGFLFYQVAL